MKLTKTYEVYIQPVQFKTIAFHHQCQYFIQFELRYYQQSSKCIKSAYPCIIKSNVGQLNNYTTMNYIPCKNYAQTLKFPIMFNDQIINIKGATKFIIETQFDMKRQKNIKIQSPEIMITLWKYNNIDSNDINHKKSSNHQQIEKVGQEIISINFQVQKDYSQYTNYRHIAFTENQYFSSLLFYIDFYDLGLNLRPKNWKKHSQINQLSIQNQIKIFEKMKSSFTKHFKSTTFNELFGHNNIKRVHNILIIDRLKYFRKIVEKLKEYYNFRIKYIQNYDNIQPENIQALSSLKRSQKNTNPFNLDHLQLLEQSKNLQNLKEYYETNDINQIYENVFQDSKLINLNIKQVWNQLIKQSYRRPSQQFQTFSLKFKIDRIRYIEKFYQEYQDNVTIYDQQYLNKKIQSHRKQRIKVCSNSKYYNKNQLKHSMITFHSQKKQNLISKTLAQQQCQILVVLVHGLKGSNRDMAKIKSFISTFTSINFLPLQTLRKCSDEDINTLGKKGAEQIQEFLKKKPHIKSINMIGFSLGGVISKSILRHLQHHKQKFNLFMTLSSPHLGISQIQSCLVNTGIMWLKKINKIKNLKQICIEPLNKKQNKLTLLQLSNEKVLSWFNHVVLIGSNQDTYVPKYSSLMSYKGDNLIVRQIQSNTLQKISSIDRLTVWFQYEENLVQKITRKKGHISFIEDSTFLQYIILKYLHFF